MRVIHKDGRVGWATPTLFRRPDPEGTPCREIMLIDGYDGPEYWDTADLRPLGPIEKELRRTIKNKGSVHGLSYEAWTLFSLTSGCGVGVGGWNIPDRYSEAIEACERIWEQHGVAI